MPGHDDLVGSTLGSSDPPAAVRVANPGWRDPRLWVGAAIVAASVVAGARLVGAADDSVPVWAVSADMAVGDTVTVDDLVARQVRFVDPDQLDAYFPADADLPSDLSLRQGVGAGELLPRGAVGAGDSETWHLPVAVDPALVPPSVQPGSVVDVYLTGASDEDSSGATDRGQPVLSEVSVIEAPTLDEGFAVSGRRQLVLGVDEDDAARFFRLVGALDAPTLVIVRRG